MPKLTCPCGHVINLSPVPVPGERIFLPADEWDEAIAAVVEAAAKIGGGDRALLGEAINDTLAGFTSSVYTCPRCGRLAVPEPDGKRYRFYKPEPQPVEQEVDDPFERPEAQPILRGIQKLKQGHVPDERCAFCNGRIEFEAWGPPGSTTPNSFRWKCPCGKSNGVLLGI